jgi:ketosteroid isomerase-like protein
MIKRLVLAASIAFAAMPALAQDGRTPTDAVDGFHTALRIGDTAAALSLLARDLVVYEFGVIDPTVEAYAFRHLPLDMDMAAATTWTLEERQLGGEGDTRWVLSTYHVTGVDGVGGPIDHRVYETAVVVRSGDRFRISHLHWSTDDPAYQAAAQGIRLNAPAGP